MQLKGRKMKLVIPPNAKNCNCWMREYSGKIVTIKSPIPTSIGGIGRTKGWVRIHEDGSNFSYSLDWMSPVKLIRRKLCS